MYEKSRVVNATLALTYLVSAAVVVAVYREQLGALARDLRGWYAQAFAPKHVHIRSLPGKMWRDVEGAIDDAGV